MPVNWFLPSTATATLTVGVARGDASQLKVPPGAEVGDRIGPSTDPLSIGVTNVGSLAGDISLRIKDTYDDSVIWTGSITLAIGEFGWVYPAPGYVMPARDLTLRAEAYHDTIVDSYVDATVMLIVRVDTAMTLTLEPAGIEPGGVYHYMGQLTRIDTGGGLAAMSIIARRYEAGAWVDVGTGTTDADGYYDVSVTAPATIGDFDCLAAFPGVVPFAASSAQASLGVGAVLKPLIAAASATLGLALVMLGHSR